MFQELCLKKIHKMEFRVLITVIVLITGSANAKRTKAVKNKVDCGITGLKFIKDLTLQTQILELQITLRFLTNWRSLFQQLFHGSLNSYLNHPYEELGTFLQTLKDSVETSTAEFTQIHIANLPRLVATLHNMKTSQLVVD